MERPISGTLTGVGGGDDVDESTGDNVGRGAVGVGA